MHLKNRKQVLYMYTPAVKSNDLDRLDGAEH